MLAAARRPSFLDEFYEFAGRTAQRRGALARIGQSLLDVGRFDVRQLQGVEARNSPLTTVRGFAFVV